jgi:type I restriction-modification system DNA methylase subunit
LTSRACTASRCAPRAATSDEVGNGVRNDFEALLFLAADKLRKDLEPSDYKHVVLGLIFLKHISNSFEAKHAALLAESAAARGHKLSAGRDGAEGTSLWMALEATTERPGTRRAGESKARAMSTQTSEEIAAASAALP